MSDLLSIASSGVNAYQNALATVSNNIANVNTDGYTRQDVSIASNEPTRQGSGYIGTGARFDQVRRQYDAFLESNLRASNSDLEAAGPMVSYVNRLIDVMGNESIGLTTAMNTFFSSARTLAGDPASDVSRSSFLRDTDGLAARFRQLSTQFQLLDDETRQSVQTDIGQVNSLTSQLAQINKQLNKNSRVDQQPSELLDQRDLLLRQLSSLMAVKTKFADNGAVLVSAGDTIDQGILVNGIDAHAISAVPSPADPGRLQLVLDPYGNPKTLPNISSGKISGTMNFRDQVLGPTRSALDDLARQLAAAVNAVHREGLDAEGQLGGDLLGFAPGQTGTAAGIQSLIQDTRRIAAAAQFRVGDDPLNGGTAQARVAYGTPGYGNPAWAMDIASHKSPGIGVIGTALNPLNIAGAPLPVGLIPAGMREVAITLQNPTATQSFQVMTRDGRHLLGSGNQSGLVTQASGMETGATYDQSLLNRSADGAYLGMKLFMGAKADVGEVQQFDPKTSAVLPSTPIPAVLSGNVFSSFSGPVAANTFTLNGVAMPALSGSGSGGTVTLSDVVDWINAQTGTGVSASASDDGRLVISRPSGNVTDDIRLGMGSAGTPADLGRLGFDTSIHLDGAASDDLLVFVTDSASTTSQPTQATISAQYGSIQSDMKQTLRTQNLEINFTSATAYTITDTASHAVLAQRTLSGTPPTIEYRGLKVTLSAAPQANDKFTIDGNRDGIGNNANLLDLVALETARVMPGGKTLTETYIEDVNQVGNIAKQASISQAALTVVHDQAVQARDAVSGVSLDEEAADLVKFQQAYQANSKVMQVASQLFDAILQVG